jgi:hypothetical protein
VESSAELKKRIQRFEYLLVTLQVELDHFIALKREHYELSTLSHRHKA